MFQPGSSLTIPHARAELEAGLKAIARGEAQFDMASVKEIDSAAVATLLAWQRAARQNGRSLSFSNMPQSLLSLARLYGVDGFLAA